VLPAVTPRLQSATIGFVIRPLVFPALAVVVCAGCSSLPESFPPPAQRAALTVPPTAGLGYFVAMSDANSSAYVVQGIADRTEMPWRWAYEHPVLRFLAPDVGRLQFMLDFSLPERTFRQTGPVTLTFIMNGKFFDRVRFDTPGQLHYAHPVAPEFLNRHGETRVAIDPEPVWVSKADGGKLGFIITRAGFAE
jgi:hypothetical protein